LYVDDAELVVSEPPLAAILEATCAAHVAVKLGELAVE
jgi:hypothetical protein